MPPRTSKALTQNDIDEYIDQESDFAFELAIRKKLSEAGFNCSHAGSYRDPITDKIRAYDFRARRSIAQNMHIRLAVECKNIKPENPLLVYATERTDQEAYHCLLLRERFQGYTFCNPTKRSERLSVYPTKEPVGRCTDLVARAPDNSFKPPNDSVVYERLLQAVHSTEGLVREAAAENLSGKHLFAVIPMLVVPDNLLWQVDYAEDGRLLKRPRLVPRSTLFFGHSWTVPGGTNNVTYTVSHLEIVTIGLLKHRVDEFIQVDQLFKDTTKLLAPDP